MACDKSSMGIYYFLKFFNQVKSRYLCFTSRKISIG